MREKATVLIVEDELITAESIAELLIEEEYIIAGIEGCDYRFEYLQPGRRISPGGCLRYQYKGLRKRNDPRKKIKRDIRVRNYFYNRLFRRQNPAICF